MITFVHDEAAYEEALEISQMLFSGKIQTLTLAQVQSCFNGVPSIEMEEDTKILNALVQVGAASSNREARQFVTGGSVLINGEKVTDVEFVIKKENAFGKEATVIRRGKKNYYVINHK